MKGTRTAKVFRGTPRNLAFLARKLRAGELVAVPTETVYGLAGNAFDPEACAAIFRAKGRPTADPLIVHLHALKQLGEVCTPNDAALRLAKAFWPGPLTLVLPKKDSVPDIVTAGRPSVAVRMPRHPLFRRLLSLANVPLAAPSANAFGYISPTTAEHVRDGLGQKIRYILDGGAAAIGLESSIVDLRDPQKPAILRPGAITAAELTRVLGRRVAQANAKRSASPSVAQIAPGQLARHYSPRTPLRLHAKLGRLGKRGENEAVVYLQKPDRAQESSNVFWLDRQGDLRGVARRLFALLRELDARRFDAIHVELAPESGLGHAINDRLRRAAAR